MKQVVCRQHALDPTVALAVVEAEAPACPPEGVVVEVRCRPVNPADVLLMTGRHLYKPTLPEPVGVEGAGVVVQAGARSARRVGEWVAIPWGGTWRERMALLDDAVLPLPDGVDPEQASMLSVNPFTAAGLLEGVAPGASLALNAGTSAVSALVLALCRTRGVDAVAIVRDGGAVEKVLARGAAAVVVDGPELPARLRAAARGPLTRGLDAVAGAASGQLFEALAEGGTLVTYGLLAGDEVRLPAAELVFRDVTVRGFSRLRWLRALTPQRRAALTAELVGLVERGVLTSAVEARYPLAEAVAAVAHHERRGRSGKILLTS
ncbi:MAG: zinc-binding dehydrogenase [Myxococcaceae bacterium]|jgi:trans-2-enoyl-CoA reductase|nr:zinc-binding dehydrogenase [Myxococcaceae bacterium]MCA3016168.1 zinc-binding dehydrogenase [Myxococcaceae bacterium]